MAKKLTTLLLIVLIFSLSTGRAFAAGTPTPSAVGQPCTRSLSDLQGNCPSNKYVCVGAESTRGPVQTSGTCQLASGNAAALTNLDCANTAVAITNYTVITGGTLVGLVGASTAAGFLNFSILGFGVQAGDGIIALSDLLLRHFTRAVLWGLLSTLAILIIGYFFQFALVLNTTILSTNIIHNIYAMLLNLVDIGFVIALIIMAFATMFRNDKYGYKKNLPKFLAAALLINFGFFFAKAVINIGDTVTTVFADAVSGVQYSSAAGLPSNFGEAASLSNVFNTASITCSVNQYINISTSNANPVTGFFLAVAKPLMSVSFGSIITLIWAATLLAIVIVFLARYAFLVLLVAVMPLAWLGWIFPGIKIPLLGGKGGTFEGWWNQFLNWVFIGPLLIFLLYISRSMTNWFIQNASQISTIHGPLVLSSQLLIQLIIILLINVIGLFAAVKMSGAAGAMVVAGVGGGLGFIAQKVTNYSGGLATRAKIRSEAYEKSSAEAEKQGDISTARLHRTLARGLSVTGRTLSGVALPPQYREVLGRAGIKVPQEKEFDLSKSIEGAEGKYKQMISADVLRAAKMEAKSDRTRDPVRSAALLKNLIDRKQLNRLTSSEIAPLLTSAASIGAQKDMLSARPDLSGTLKGKNIEDITQIDGYLSEFEKASKKIKPDKIRDISVPIDKPDGDDPPDKQLAVHEAYLLKLTPQQVGQIIKFSSPEEQEALVGAIKGMAGLRNLVKRQGTRQQELANIYSGNPTLAADIQNKTNSLIDYIQNGGRGRRRRIDVDLLNIWNQY